MTPPTQTCFHVPFPKKHFFIQLSGVRKEMYQTKQCLKEHKSNRPCNNTKPSRLRSHCWMSVLCPTEVRLPGDMPGLCGLTGRSSLEGFACLNRDGPGFIVLSLFANFSAWTTACCTIVNAVSLAAPMDALLFCLYQLSLVSNSHRLR